MKPQLTVLLKTLDLEKSEVLHRFDTFNPDDWTKTCGTPPWRVTPNEIFGGDDATDTHGQIFYREPVDGDVVLEFDARIIAPSYHDLVWFWNVDFGGAPWGAGYLGCLGGWWSGRAGIEKLPDYAASAIAPSFPTEPERTYHIVSGSMGGTHFIFVDGRLVTSFLDANYPKGRPGHFGFGVYESHAAYSNLVVYRPSWSEFPPPPYPRVRS